VSHIATYKSTLKGVDPVLLQAAFAALIQQNAEKHGWKATAEVYDYVMGNPTACMAGVIGGQYPYGIGVNINAQGELEYVGDLDMQPWRKLQQDLENYYVALGFMSCGETSVNIYDEGDVQIEMEIQF
jgi:hypothetical protein